MNALVPANSNPAALAPVDDVWRMAQAVARSGLFGMKSPEEAMALMLIAQAEGQHPAVAARDYHIVDGRPTLKADAMLARFMQAGGKVEWHSYTDDKVEATFSHPQGGKITLDWTMARAKKITRKGKAITEGDNWRNYPRQMLRARTISEGIRTVFPGVSVGVYTPEEVADFDEPKAVEVRDVTPKRAPKAEPPRPREETAREAPPAENPVDRSADVVPVPEGDSPADWERYRKVIATKINRASTPEAVAMVQTANAAGLTRCAEVLADTQERIASFVDAKLATLGITQREPEAEAA